MKNIQDQINFMVFNATLYTNNQVWNLSGQKEDKNRVIT